MTDLRPIREALRFAVEIAREGEIADPPVHAPEAIRRFLTFRRLSGSSLTAIAAVLESDDEFRMRVADRATEDEVGRAGMLWLTRPDGWEAAFTTAVAAGPDDPREREALLNRLRRERDGAQSAAERVRDELATVSEARDRLAERLGRAESDARRDAARHDEITMKLDAMREERNAAVRQLKEIEAEAAELRRRLNVAREATRDAEAELSDLRRGDRHGPGPAPGRSTASSAAGPADQHGDEPDEPDEPRRSDSPFTGSASPGEPDEPVEPRLDRRRLGKAVTNAARAASELARFLDEAGDALEIGDDADGTARARGGSAGDHRDAHQVRASARSGGAAQPDRPGSPGSRRGAEAGHRRRRRRPSLPFGVVEPSDRAIAAYLEDPANLIVVDGYNLARTLWTDATPEEERRWIVSLLEEVRSRTGVDVRVIFDGQDGLTSPTTSRTIRVGFSPTGVTADEVILHLIRDLPVEQPVVVVSSDREIAEGARAAGAAVVGSADFIRVARG